MQNAQQDFEKLFRNELEAVKFEISDLEFQRLMSAWNVALSRLSLQKMDVDIDIYKQIAAVLESNGDRQFNLFNASFLFNAISTLSPNDLGVHVHQYIRLNDYQKELTDRWNEIVKPIRTKLLNKLQTQHALSMGNNGKSVIPVKGR